MNGFENAFDRQESVNVANEIALTRGAAGVWEWAAKPLAEHVFTPLAERSYPAGVAALNAGLTAPRLLKPLVGRSYEDHVSNGQSWKAVGDVAAGIVFDLSDGLDGAVARASGLQTEFGTGFDPFVDAVSLGDDSRRVRSRARAEGDSLVLRMLSIENKIKLGSVVLGGPGAKLTAMAVERKGIELTRDEQPHAVPMGKAFFAASAASKKALQLGYAFPENSFARKAWRTAGVGLLGTAIGFGGAANVQYLGANLKRIKKLFQH